MATEKIDAITLIERLPDSVSAETIITELQFRLTVLRRGADAERGEQLVSHAEAKRRLSTWVDSPGT